MNSVNFILWVGAVLALGSSLSTAPPAHAETASNAAVNVSTRDDLAQALGSARPGTRILVAPGTYEGGLSFAGLQGTADAPIVLAASDKSQPPVFKGGGSGFHLSDTGYLEIHDIVIAEADGNGINIDDGGSYETPAHHILLKNLRIQDIGPTGNRDGIKLSGVDDFVIEGCIVERWGDGGSAIDMVGCHRGRIVGSTFRYRGDLPANGVQAKGGSSDIRISNCRFDDAGSRAVNIGGSTGAAYFRPRSAGYEAKDISVEDCIFIGSLAPIAFVGVDGATVRYNTIYRPKRWVIRILQESRGERFAPCRNGVFANNIIAFRSDEMSTAVNIGGGTAPETFSFSRNHWYCIDNPQRSDRLSLPVEEEFGSYGENPRFVDEQSQNLRLDSTSPVQDAGVRVVQRTSIAPIAPASDQMRSRP